MLTLHFSKEINAPAQNVWDTLWTPNTYLIWTRAFNPEDAGGSIQSDWQVGGKTLVQTSAEWEKHMSSAFAKGLNEVKKLSEQEN